jgi:hypothetical protein
LLADERICSSEPAAKKQQLAARLNPVPAGAVVAWFIVIKRPLMFGGRGFPADCQYFCHFFTAANRGIIRHYGFSAFFTFKFLLCHTGPPFIIVLLYFIQYWRISQLRSKQSSFRTGTGLFNMPAGHAMSFRPYPAGQL